MSGLGDLDKHGGKDIDVKAFLKGKSRQAKMIAPRGTATRNVEHARAQNTRGWTRPDKLTDDPLRRRK